MRFVVFKYLKNGSEVLGDFLSITEAEPGRAKIWYFNTDREVTFSYIDEVFLVKY